MSRKERREEYLEIRIACIKEEISDLLKDLECDINNIIVEELKVKKE